MTNPSSIGHGISLFEFQSVVEIVSKFGQIWNIRKLNQVLLSKYFWSTLKYCRNTYVKTTQNQKVHTKIGANIYIVFLQLKWHCWVLLTVQGYNIIVFSLKSWGQNKKSLKIRCKSTTEVESEVRTHLLSIYFCSTLSLLNFLWWNL